MKNKIKKLLRIEEPSEIAKLAPEQWEELNEEKHQTKYWCDCKGCQEERAAFLKQLNHPFYERVDQFREQIKFKTLEKAAKKYNEPFNPDSWSVKELGEHAMAENYDQGNYIVGLYEKAEALEKENALLLEALKFYADPINYDAQHKLEIMKDCGEKARSIIKELEK